MQISSDDGGCSIGSCGVFVQPSPAAVWRPGSPVLHDARAEGLPSWLIIPAATRTAPSLLVAKNSARSRTPVSAEEVMKKMMEVMEVDETEVMQLFEAMQVDEAEVMKMFDVMQVDDAEVVQMREAKPPLLQAVQAGRMTDLKDMLSEGADVNVRSPFDDSAALHLTAVHGRSRIASTLLKYGADKDAIDEAGETPLMKAAELGHHAVVDILLKAGADVNVFSCSYARGRAALHFASGEGHYGIVQTLLDRGAEKDAQDDRGYTPLIWAISGGSLPVIKTLLKAGADVTIRSTDATSGVTALHVAASTGHNDIASALLLAGAGKDALDSDGDTPLISASKTGDLAVVKTLVAAGANLDIRGTDSDGFAALHIAAFEGYIRVVKFFLEKGADKDIRSTHGATALSLAANQGRLRVVETLLDFGADLTIPTTPNRHTPLYYAVHAGRPDIVSTLLEWGANSLVTDRDDKTPLEWAARHGKAREVEVMMVNRAALGQSSPDGCLALYLSADHGHSAVTSALSQGANKDAVDCDGEKPLLWALDRGHVKMAAALLKAGVDINVRRGRDRAAALHLAAGGGHDGIVSALLRKAANKDVPDNTGSTPLHWATAEGHLAVVKTLLAAGVNLNIPSRDDGFSALHRAAGEGYHRIVSVLLSSGADADVVDPNGETALNWAARLGHGRVVEVLLAAGANVRIRNIEGYSALDWATKRGHVGVQKAIRGCLAEANTNGEDSCTDMHLDSHNIQVDPTQALIEEEFNFGRWGQTESGGVKFRGVLAVPGWLDVEGVCLVVVLLLWFSSRCKLRS